MRHPVAMRRRSSDVPTENEGLSQFTKNRFFKGKLMTPRIMESSREYHSERLETLNRYIDGTGIVHGLDIESVSQTEDGLDVTIDAGLAIDGHGRPIVVEQATTKSLPAISADELYLFIQYDEVAVETVPVPDTDGAIEEDAVPNRLVETFQLTHRETPPEREPSAQAFDYTRLDLDTTDPTQLMETIAEQYHVQHRRNSHAPSDPAVYLGAFERGHDGSWVAATDAPARQYVYDHGLLFSLVVHHLADTNNPHETPVHEPIDPQPDDIDALNERMNALEGTIGELQRERDTFVQYTLRKTTKDRSRFFRRLSDRIEQANGEGSRLARETAQLSTDDILNEQDMETAYRHQLSELLGHLIQIGDLLEGVVTEDSLERYLIAVSQLQSAIESDAELLELLEADNRVCESADSLNVLVDVVPDI